MILQRVAQSLRNGGPKELQLQRFMIQIHTSHIMERESNQFQMWNMYRSLVKVERKGYDIEEATYVRVIMNWRKASDMRGLSDEQREKYKDLMDYILDELMPWHKQQTRDFSLMEINQ